MSEFVALDPTIAAILREVASQPDFILRLPSRLTVSAFNADSRASAHGTGLSSAERELLTVYRNDVAWLLRQVCLRKVVDGPGKLLVSRYITSKKQCELLDPLIVRSEVESLRSSRDGATWAADSDPFALLEASIASSPVKEPSIAALAAASFRLEPTNQSRLLASIGLIHDGRYNSALRLAADVLTCNPTDSNRITALECISHVQWKRKALASAREAAKTATELDDEQLQSPINWLAYALQAGDGRDARDAANVLETRCTPNDRLLDWFVASVTQRRKLGEWAPTTDGRKLAAQIAPRLGPAGRRIAHVLA